MKITLTACVILILFSSISWTENNNIQSVVNSDENSTQQEAALGVTSYPSVKIGTQVWMKKNLNLNHYQNGDVIPQIQDSAKWSKLTTGAWCWFKNNSDTGAVYGKLYNWYAVNDPRGLAPAGWHIASDAEWTTVQDYLGGNAKNAGGQLKEAGASHWLDPNVNAKNTTGYTALPGGYRDEFGQFAYLHFLGYWWTSTGNGPKAAFCRRMVAYGGFIDRMAYEKNKAFAVRCVKD